MASKKSLKMRKIQLVTMTTKKMQRARATLAKPVMSQAVNVLTTQSYQKQAKTGTRWRKKPSRRIVKQQLIATQETSNVAAHLADTQLNLADVDERINYKRQKQQYDRVNNNHQKN